MKTVKIGVIGCGQRGSFLAKTIDTIPEYELMILCDTNEELAKKVVDDCKNNNPATTTDINDVFESGIDAVIIATGWDKHIPFSIEAMKLGIAVGVEVGGSHSIEECESLVNTYEQTNTPFMLLENCCYGKSELLATSMERNGFFGKVSHCHGAYAHDLRKLLVERDYYRLKEYIAHNCENYPTHELGPIAKLLNINSGNRMVSLVSVASSEAGITEYLKDHKDLYPHLAGQSFAQGDIITTIIKCENGETISLRLDTSLPRHYNREFTVHGTKAVYEMGCNLVFEDGMEEIYDPVEFYHKYFDNAKKFEDDFLPDLWKNTTKEQLEAGHGGMDYLELRDFALRLINNQPMPIDVYDAASWMVVSALSEKSIKEGGTPQSFPDFTKGMWKTRKTVDVTEMPHPAAK